MSSIRAWTEAIAAAIDGALHHEQSWRLHVAAHYEGCSDTWGVARRRARRALLQGVVANDPVPRKPRTNAHAGQRRCALIRAGVGEWLQKRRRKLGRHLRGDSTPFAPEDSLVQVLLTSPDQGWLSIANAPLPYQRRQMIWPFPKGEVPPASDQAAPSRAFAKLVEVESRLGVRIAPGETCVDLGAAPGGWSYVALQRGASVTAVDRAPLRDDLMRHPRLHYLRGDAFDFAPQVPVDWLLCDVIAAPQRSIDLLLRWLQQGWARRFAVTIKFKGREDYPRLDQLKAAVPALAAEWFLLRLSANKNEVCAFGAAPARTQTLLMKNSVP